MRARSGQAMSKRWPSGGAPWPVMAKACATWAASGQPAGATVRGTGLYRTVLYSVHWPAAAVPGRKSLGRLESRGATGRLVDGVLLFRGGWLGRGGSFCFGGGSVCLGAAEVRPDSRDYNYLCALVVVVSSQV
jgi:hypothetical protein